MLTESRCFTHRPQRRRTRPAQQLAWAILFGLILPRLAPAATFTVNSADDVVDANPGDGICATTAGGATCTLRAAIQESNRSAGPDSIDIPAKTYTLALGGRNEDAAATGDLDILEDLTINGSTAGQTRISANGIDRVFDVIGPAVVSITHIIIQDGLALGDSGGGIRNDATLTLAQVALHSNHALNGVGTDGDGGAIVNFNTGELTLVNVTVSGNTADNGGGAIATIDPGVVHLTNVTITGNGAPAGGGIRNLGIVHLVNSIVAKNTGGGNCSGRSVDSLGFNLEDTNSCLFDAAGDLANTDPLFTAPLFDYGGYTLTVPLSPGSPAIDAANAGSCPGTDQRGFPRPIDGNGDAIATCDIGAFEVQPNVTPTTTPGASATPTATAPPTETATLAGSPLPTGTAPPTPTVTATSTPRGPTIIIGMATGYPGDRVTFSATIDTAGVDISSEQSDITFDVANAPIAALPNGAPDCTINASLGVGASFSFNSFAGCQGQTACCCAMSAPPCPGTACTTLRAAVLSLSFPLTALPDGALLYTCHVNIAASAAPATYPLTQRNIVMSDLQGGALPGTGGDDGAIVVLEPPTPTPVPTDTPTPTVSPSPTVSPTHTPLPTLTPTPTVSASATPSATPSPTATRPAPCVGDCDGSSDVTVDELVTMVNIALEIAPPANCTAGDADHSGGITIEEILLAVNNALGVCTT